MIEGTATPARDPDAPVIDWGRLKAGLGVAPDERATSPRDHYLRGVSDLKSDRIEAAIAEFHSVLSVEPHHGAARADLAWALLRNQRRDEARAEARLAQRDAPDLPGPDIVLGILAQDAGNHQAAIRYLLDAATRSPDDPTTHLRLASSYAALGDSPNETYHLGRHFRLSLLPDRATLLYQQVLANPQTDPELKRVAEHELALIAREGV
jgi:Flp pilus assembly protein TadD